MLGLYRRLLIISIIIIAGSLFLLGWDSFFDKFFGRESSSMSIVISNFTPEELCEVIEEELNREKIEGVKDKWECVPVYEKNTTYEDVVFNKTTGLCNCSATLIDERAIYVQVRKVKE